MSIAHSLRMLRFVDRYTHTHTYAHRACRGAKVHTIARSAMRRVCYDGDVAPCLCCGVLSQCCYKNTTHPLARSLAKHLIKRFFAIKAPGGRGFLRRLQRILGRSVPFRSVALRCVALPAHWDTINEKSRAASRGSFFQRAAGKRPWSERIRRRTETETVKREGEREPLMGSLDRVESACEKPFGKETRDNARTRGRFLTIPCKSLLLIMPNVHNVRQWKDAYLPCARKISAFCSSCIIAR